LLGFLQLASWAFVRYRAIKYVTLKAFFFFKRFSNVLSSDIGYMNVFWRMLLYSNLTSQEGK